MGDKEKEKEDEPPYIVDASAKDMDLQMDSTPKVILSSSPGMNSPEFLAYFEKFMVENSSFYAKELEMERDMNDDDDDDDDDTYSDDEDEDDEEYQAWQNEMD